MAVDRFEVGKRYRFKSGETATCMLIKEEERQVQFDHFIYPIPFFWMYQRDKDTGYYPFDLAIRKQKCTLVEE